MDPISAIGIATTAFNALKAGFEHGREIEQMVGDIGRWSSAAMDVRKGHAKEKQKKRAWGSDFKLEALETYVHEQEIKKQEEYIRQQINWNYGPQSWERVLQIQADLRKEALEEQARREHRFNQIIEYGTYAAIGIIAISALLGWTQFLMYSGS